MISPGELRGLRGLAEPYTGPKLISGEVIHAEGWEEEVPIHRQGEEGSGLLLQEEEKGR